STIYVKRCVGPQRLLGLADSIGHHCRRSLPRRLQAILRCGEAASGSAGRHLRHGHGLAIASWCSRQRTSRNMMDHLLTVARDLGGQLQESLSHVTNSVRGAMVGIDRLWLHSYAYNLLVSSHLGSQVGAQPTQFTALRRLQAFGNLEPSFWKF